MPRLEISSFLISVQFKMVSMRSGKKSHIIGMRSTPFPKRCLWNSFNVRLTDDCLFSSFQGRSLESFLFPRLFPPGEQLCDVFGFVPAGMYMFRTSQRFRFCETQANCDGCFAFFPQVYLLASFACGAFQPCCPPTTRNKHNTTECSRLYNQHKLSRCSPSLPLLPKPLWNTGPLAKSCLWMKRIL